MSPKPTDTRGLAELPDEVFDLADTLEVLNLSGNALSSLPDDLHRLPHLRVLFCSDNAFTELPECLGQCAKLSMIGFKANQISHVSAAALPPLLRWLILTDNRISQLPSELGERPLLQKLMLAGNQLTQLPESLTNCSNLELIRIASNRLTGLPDWLLALPSLTWLAYAGNPVEMAADVAEAARFLKLLSGRNHRVFTGVAVVRDGRTAVRVNETRVTFKPLCDQEIATDVAAGAGGGPHGAGGGDEP